jgi:hypothetical protein
MAATRCGICVPSRHLLYRTEKYEYHDNLDRVALYSVAFWQDVSSLAENMTSLFQISDFQHVFQHLPLTYLYLPNLRAEYPLRSSILTSSLVRGEGRSCEMAPHMSKPSIPVSCDTSPPANTRENDQLYVCLYSDTQWLRVAQSEG